MMRGVCVGEKTQKLGVCQKKTLVCLQVVKNCGWGMGGVGGGGGWWDGCAKQSLAKLFFSPNVSLDTRELSPQLLETPSSFLETPPSQTSLCPTEGLFSRNCPCFSSCNCPSFYLIWIFSFLPCGPWFSESSSRLLWSLGVWLPGFLFFFGLLSCCWLPFFLVYIYAVFFVDFAEFCDFLWPLASAFRTSASPVVPRSRTGFWLFSLASWLSVCGGKGGAPGPQPPTLFFT